ncbi:hypothetical protein [Hymenobacter koreensis]|uniref:Uncharacterized protein n=1 Tax=Hymenobacter koreensis TaxID=1084523 RepID=A0ABP8J6K1_9BACT
MQDADVLAVRDAIVQQAKHLLTEAGEFYPFGMVLKKDGLVVPVSAFEADEQPELETLVPLLENDIRTELASGKCLAGGIGVDVCLRFSADTPPTDALHIRLLRHDGQAVDYYMTYRLAEDRLICDPLFEDVGTFTLE